MWIVLIPASLDDPGLDPLGRLARNRLDLILRSAFQVGIGILGEVFSQGLQSGMRVETEDKADVLRVVPAVQMLGLCEVGVAPQQ